MTYPILFCALLATAIGQSVFLTTVPSLGRLAGLSEMQVAVMMSASAGVFAIAANIWSRYTQRFGYKRLLLTGLTGYTVGTVIFATIWWIALRQWISVEALFAGLLLSRCLQSTIMSATPPSAVGYVVAISTSDERAAAISKVTSGNNLGQILGPVLAGLLVSAGLLAPYYFVILFTLAAIILVYCKLPDIGAGDRARPRASANVLMQPVKASTALLITCCICLFACMAIIQQSLAFFLMDSQQLTAVAAARASGLAMMMTAVFSLLIQFTLVQRRWLAQTTLIYLALPVTALAYTLLYLQQSTATLIVGMALLGVGLGAAYPSLAAVATTRCHPDRQAAVTGLLTAAPAMGYITGPPLSAALYNLEHRLPFLLAALLMAASTLAIWWRLPTATNTQSST